MLNNNVVSMLENTRNYMSDFDESIPVVNFSALGMKDLRSLTPYKVNQVVGNNWLPNGLIAWNLADNGKKLNMIFFKGKAAVVTTVLESSVDIDELFRRASELNNFKNRRVVSMCA